MRAALEKARRAVTTLRNYSENWNVGAEGVRFQETSDAMDRTEAWDYEEDEKGPTRRLALS